MWNQSISNLVVDYMTRIVNKIRMIAGERTNVSKELILRDIIIYDKDS